MGMSDFETKHGRLGNVEKIFFKIAACALTHIDIPISIKKLQS